MLRHVLLAPMIAGSLSAAQDPLAGLRDHPRLLLSQERVGELRGQRGKDPNLDRLCAAIAQRADLILAMPVATYQLEGVKRFRLLGTSRQTLARVLALGVAHRLDPRPVWRDRLLAELEAVCAFADWHPEHFLDTAEMTTAVAIGYDWLHAELDAPTRARLREALVRLGLKPGLDPKHWWLAGTNNWNQVCHGGLVLGALAVAEDEGELARTLVSRAVEKTASGLTAYAPDGVYPEGPTYWDYGSSYTVLTAAALESALGSDQGLSDAVGFAASFDYVLHEHGPLGIVFNYADSGMSVPRSVLHLWAARRWGRPDLAAWTWPSFASWLDDAPETATNASLSNRFLPLAVAWYSPPPADPARPLSWFAAGNGPVHLALMRSAWHDPEAVFVGFKGGKLQVNHGHLDVGSFVLDAAGVRWAHDLGMEREIYDRTDSWGLDQQAHRWDFLRANNRSHNTLTIGDALQQVAGMSPLVDHQDGEGRSYAILDLSAAYAGQAAKVRRGIALVDGRRQVLIRDEITAPTGAVRWTMVTRAEIAISTDGRTATLSEKGKSLTLRLVSGPPGLGFSVGDLTPPTEAENPNDGFRRLLLDAPGTGDLVLGVLATPGGIAPATDADGPLGDWPKRD